MSQATQAIRMAIETLRYVEAANISGTYTPLTQGVLSTAPIIYPARQFLIQNFTDVELIYSIDGFDDQIILPSNGFFLSDITSNKTSAAAGWFLAEGTIMYVRAFSSSLPTINAAYFTSFYGNDL